MGADISVSERISHLLDSLRIERAHFAGSMLADIAGLAQTHPERIASLTLVCPPRVEPSTLHSSGNRLLIIAGDQPAGGRGAPHNCESARCSAGVAPWLFQSPWADLRADCTAGTV
jgi:hypothetical protein